MTTTNPVMFELGRKLRRLTQAELADRSCISQPVISRLEAFSGMPDDQTAVAIARALHLPVEFFSIPGRLFPPSTPLRRSRTGLRKKVKDYVEAVANLLRLHIGLISDHIELDDQIPRLSVDEYGSPEEVARVVRRYFKLPRGPIGHVTNLLENHGVIIYTMDFGTTELDAFTMIGDGVHPIVIVNDAFPGERVRLNLVHELAHIVMHGLPGNPAEMEQEAWAFTGEFLAPEEEIYHELESVTRLQTYGLLKRKWRISIQALIMRASRLGAITPNQERYLWVQVNKAGWRKQEPLEMPIEQPSMLKEVFELLTRGLEFSREELARYLRVDTVLLDELYGGLLDDNTGPRLRVVR